MTGWCAIAVPLAWCWPLAACVNVPGTTFALFAGGGGRTCCLNKPAFIILNIFDKLMAFLKTTAAFSREGAVDELFAPSRIGGDAATDMFNLFGRLSLVEGDRVARQWLRLVDLVDLVCEPQSSNNFRTLTVSRYLRLYSVQPLANC